jgi:uncharacterized protein YbjT (DUF2867 family)
MLVLLTGASGFIGRRLAQALLDAGYELAITSRAPAATTAQDAAHKIIRADFTEDVDENAWVARLAGVDAVINAAGIFQERGNATFELVNTRAPQALFAACVEAGVGRIIQISALGADEQARSAFHRSRVAADEFLLRLPLRATVVQPSLVFGPEGGSARTLMTLASLPLIPVPRSHALIQPVHVDDVVAGVLVLLRSTRTWPARIPFVGPAPIGLRDYLASLRRQLGLGAARFLSVPRVLSRPAARVARGRAGIPDTEALDMLERGNVADAALMTDLLGAPPRPVSGFIPPAEADTLRAAAQLRWLLPLLRVSVAVVWIASGVVSFGVYPVELSYELLDAAGVRGAPAPILLYGGATLDVAFGVMTLVLRRRRVLWLAQAAVIVLYTAIITLTMPELWAHPFAPVVKNLPMLAAILVLYQLERR